MRIFVTGATGFIGSHFVRAALAAGHTVTANGRSAEKAKEFSQTLLAGAGELLQWNHSDLRGITLDDLAGHDAILHFAAYGVSPQPCEWETAFQINVADSVSVMHRAIQAGASKIVVCGSCMEYGRSAERYDVIPADAPLEPVGPYAASKAAQSLAAEGLSRDKKTEVIILRPFNVFGEGQHPSNFWPSLKRAALAGEDFPMTPGAQVRDFVPVEDVAKMFLKAVLFSVGANEGNQGESLFRANIGTGAPQTLIEFAERCWKNWEAKGKILPGVIPYRGNEVMQYVPAIDERFRI